MKNTEIGMWSYHPRIPARLVLYNTEENLLLRVKQNVNAYRHYTKPDIYYAVSVDIEI